MKERKKKYNITLTTLPSKKQHTDEEVKILLKKAINIALDDLILNGHIKVGNS